MAGPDDQLWLEWVHDSTFRFFPAQRDELFGYVLHPADLATNKASAAADRREPRDLIDLLTTHEMILSLGATVTAAVGRFPGQSPEEMLADIKRHSRFTAEEFRVLSTAEPIDAANVHRRIRKMIEEAELFVSRIPSDAVGVLFLQAGQPVEPDPDRLDQYGRQAGSVGGIWPSSPEILRAMLGSSENRHANHRNSIRYQRPRLRGRRPASRKLEYGRTQYSGAIRGGCSLAYPGRLPAKASWPTSRSIANRSRSMVDEGPRTGANGPRSHIRRYCPIGRFLE